MDNGARVEEGGPNFTILWGTSSSQQLSSLLQRMGRRSDRLPNVPWAEGRLRVAFVSRTYRWEDGPFGEAKDSSPCRGKEAKAGSAQSSREGG